MSTRLALENALNMGQYPSPDITPKVMITLISRLDLVREKFTTEIQIDPEHSLANII